MLRSMNCIGIAVLTLLLGSTSLSVADEAAGRIENFSLSDHHGQPHSLDNLSDARLVVVAFLGTECPQARLYAGRLQDLSARFEPQGVKFLGILSNRQDSVTEIAHFAKTHEISFPLLKDPGNAVADRFGAERTPEVFVLDGQRQVRYRGRIDDQYGRGASTGYSKTEAKHNYLVDAVEALLAGREPAEAHVPSLGCLIGRIRPAAEDSSVTYGNQISRLLQKHCVECHRPGQIAPFSLTSYDEVVGWAEMMEEVVREQRMPPWHASPQFGHFANDRRLSKEEQEQLFAWVRDGAPAGDLSAVPPAIDYPEGWQLSEPEQIVSMSPDPYTVPAEGTVEYQYFIVDPGWKEDRWIRTTECLIGNRAVVHHVFVFAVPPESKVEMWDGPRTRGGDFEDGGGQLIAGAAPGTPPYAYPFEGMATFIKAGTRLLFQMHYTPDGKEETDRTAVGFTFADLAKVKHNVRTNMTINVRFKIPAGADNHRVEAERTFDRDTLLLSMAPHMHLRGKSFHYELRYPDGRSETLLDVPRFDFNWQMIYFLSEPRFIPAGTKMYTQAHFDNSENNLANPNSQDDVRWGDQTWEEMMIGWHHETTDVDSAQVPAGQSRAERFVAAATLKAPKLGKLLVRAASQAAGSARHMRSFGREVMQIAPQVDRVCIAEVAGDQVRFLGVDQAPILNHSLGGVERSYDAASAELDDYLAGGQPVVHTELASRSAGGRDIQAAAERLGSSLHIPVTVVDRKLLVSFWSRDREAFPEVAVAILKEAAQSVGFPKDAA